MSGKNGKRVGSLLLDGLLLVLGSCIFAVSVNMFTAPNHIAPGGMIGLATLLNYLTGGRLPIGITVLALNLPVFFWAFRSLGGRFLGKTLAATVLSSLVIDLSAGWLPPYRGDMLLIIVFGGALSGLGLSLIFLRGATTGGTDLIASLLSRHFRQLSMGRLLLIGDLCVVALSALVYRNFESPLYAAIVIFITSQVVDAILYGSNSGVGKMMFIISPKNEEIADRIMHQIERGVTELRSRGCYTGQEGGVLLCAVRRQEIHKTRDIIYSIDPNAFVIVGEAGEITGEGFREVPTPPLNRRKAKK